MISINYIIFFLDSYFQAIKKNYKIFITFLIFLSLIGKVIILMFYDVPQPPDARKYADIIEYYRSIGNVALLENQIELSLQLILAAPYMKVYPIIIYFLGINVVITLQIIISSLGIYLIFNISKVITKNIGTSCIVAFLYCCNPFITYYSLLTQYESFFIFFLLLGVNLFLHNRKISSYLIFILAIFINPTVEIAIPLFILSSSIFFFKNKISDSIKNLIIFLAIYLFFLSLNIYNNYKVLGTFERFYVISIFSLEYNEAYAKHGLNFDEIYKLHNKVISETCPVDPNRVDDIYYQWIDLRLCSNKALKRMSYDYITNTENTFQIVKDTFSRAERLFSIYPYDTKERHVKVISSMYYLFLYLFVIIFFTNMSFLKNKNFYPIFILIIFSLGVYLLVHAVFRYRVAYDPFLMIFASCAINSILHRIYMKYSNNHPS